MFYPVPSVQIVGSDTIKSGRTNIKKADGAFSFFPYALYFGHSLLHRLLHVVACTKKVLREENSEQFGPLQ